jgi:hypothetical protein
MVMNVGKKPTVNTGDEAASLEIHVLHTYANDFYGKVGVLLGRPLCSLHARIRTRGLDRVSCVTWAGPEGQLCIFFRVYCIPLGCSPSTLCRR